MLKAPEPVEPDLREYANHAGRTMADTDLDPDNDGFLHPGSTLDATHQARRYMREAVKHAAAGKDVAAIDSAMDAVFLQPSMLDAWGGPRRQRLPAQRQRPTPGGRQEGHQIHPQSRPG